MKKNTLFTLSSYLVLLCLSITVDAGAGVTIPSEFQLIKESPGVSLYQKHNQQYVQVIYLNEGATLELLVNPLAETPTYQNPLNTAATELYKNDASFFWQNFNLEKNAFSIVNGTFTTNEGYPTVLAAFSVKQSNIGISLGTQGSYPDDMLLFEIRGAHVKIVKETIHRIVYHDSDAPDIIGGVHPRRQISGTYAGRTFVGIIDGDNDISNGYEIVLILTSEGTTGIITQLEAENILFDFGVVVDTNNPDDYPIMMLDGSTVTSLICKSEELINLHRPFPTAIGVRSAEPPTLKQKKSWFFNENSLEGWRLYGFSDPVPDTLNEKGWLELTPLDDPALISPYLSIETSPPSPIESVDFIQFFGRNNSQDSSGKVFIKTDINGDYKETDRFIFNFPNDNRWHLIQINVHDIPGWDEANTIHGIRIDPIGFVNSGANEKIYIDYIRLKRNITNQVDPNVRWHPDGTYIKSNTSNTVYLLERGFKRPIPNGVIFEEYSYDWTNIVTVGSDDELACYPEGNPLPQPTDLERIIRRSGVDQYGNPFPKVYLVKGSDSRKKHITNEIVAENLGINLQTDIQEVTETELNLYETGPDITTIYPEGTIVKATGNANVFIISNGEARPFATQETFEKLGYYTGDDDLDGLWDSIVETKVLPQNTGAHLIDNAYIDQCGGAGDCIVNQIWPTGGETVTGGTSRETTYTVSNPSACSNTCISYSLDNSATWNIITCNAPLNSEYTWDIPDIPTTGATVRITAYDHDGRPYSASPETYLTVESNSNPGQDYFDIFNDGGVELIVDSIEMQNYPLSSHPWITLNNNQPLPPAGEPLVIGANSSIRIPVSVDKSNMFAGNYTDNVIISSNDPDVSGKTIEINLEIKEENDAPGAPLNASVSPSGWTQIQSYSLDWTNPADPSGIAGGYYRIGSPPSGNLDGTYFNIETKPIQVNSLTDGTSNVYIWLKDGEENLDFNNYAVVEILHDTAPPYLVQNFPSNGDIDLPVDASISFLSKDLFSGVDPNNFVLQINGSQVTPQIITNTGDGVWVEYQPPVHFGFNELINVSIKISDSATPDNFHEAIYSFQTFANDGDADGDGLLNDTEYQHGTDPLNSDTDTDGLSDGWEIDNGLNPTSDVGIDGADGDYNNNGLTNLQEYLDGLYYSADVASVTGAPSGTVSFDTATITIGGTGVTTYQYRVDGNSWQPERLITEQIFFSGLSDGPHTLEVIGRDVNGYWQGGTSATTASWTVDVTPGIIFDDFEDGVIDTTIWETWGNTVYERNGSLDIQTEVTDGGGGANSVWFTFDPTKPIEIERDIFLHYGNNYFIGRFHIEIDGAPGFTFGVNYANMVYASSPWEARHGIYLFRNSATGHRDTTTVNQTTSIEGIWNQWFHEKLVYDPITGVLNYYINNELKITYNIGLIPDLPSYKVRILTNPWGWFTGHYQYMDNFKLRSSLGTNLLGDINGDGVVNIADVIIGLQVLVNSNPNLLDTYEDVNGDGKIGIEEAVYAMRAAGGLLNEATTVTSAGQIWMDRNLGASRVATSSTDAEAYGDLYQWGRGTDGHEKRTSPTTSANSTTDVPGHGFFILEPGFPYDWITPQNNNLWQGVSGTNNPCPSGFRLPTVPELDTERASWSSDNAAGAFASPLKLVMAGYRSSYNNGMLGDAGSHGYYWSSEVNDIMSRRLTFRGADAGDDAYIYSSDRTSGHSVRCIKD